MRISPPPYAILTSIKAKRLAVKLASWLIPSKRLRIKFRAATLLPKIHIQQPEALPKKYGRKIDVAFCFDGNGYMPAAVAIESLLAASKCRCSYNIYCVSEGKVIAMDDGRLEKFVRSLDRESSLRFINQNGDFDDSRPGEYINISMYWRFELAKLLPKSTRIIYSDIDVIFTRDLIGLDSLDIGTNMMAAPGEKGGYYCSSLLVMDLAKIRKEKIYGTWLALSKDDEYFRTPRVFYVPDMEILNHTCRDRLLPLSRSIYNFIPYEFTNFRKEWESHNIQPSRIHYAGPKPWSDDPHGEALAHIWREHAERTPMYHDWLKGKAC